MHCGLSAAGMGSRPEESDKETTSLGMPPVPSPDGCQHPACLPEIGHQTKDPASRLLDRSVSAPSIGSPGSSWAETVKPRAATSVDALHERSATLDNRELLPSMPNFSDPIASANISTSPDEKTGERPCQSPSVPPRSISEEAITGGRLQKPEAEKDPLDLQPPVELGGGQGPFSDPRSQAEELDVPLLLEPVEQHPTGELRLDLKACRKPEMERNKPDCEKPLRSTAFPPSAAGVEQGPDGLFSEGRTGIEGKRWVSSPEKRRWQEVEGGTLETDTTKEALVAANNLLNNPNFPPATAEGSPMEVELPEPPSSSPLRSLVGDRAHTSGGACTSRDVSAPAGPTEAPAGGQPSDWADEPCISLTSALKELHQLLIVNSKPVVDASQPEDGRPAQEQATDSEGDREEHEDAHLDSRAMQLSFPGSAGVESAGEEQAFQAKGASPGAREIHRLAVCHEEDLLTVQGASALDSCGFLSPPAFSSQVRSRECVEIVSRHLSSGQVLSREASEQSRPPSFGLGQGHSSPFSEKTELSDTSGTNSQEPASELAESSTSLPAASHAADVAEIVRAGFTPQEAAEALGRAGGNAELALLILLAKNIVVPT